MTNRKTTSIIRRNYPHPMNHADTMRAWANKHLALENRKLIREDAYWDTHIHIYQRLNTGPMYCLRRWYLTS